MRGVQLVLQGRGVLAALLAEESKRLLLSVLIARSVACSVIVPAVFARDNSIPVQERTAFCQGKGCTTGAVTASPLLTPALHSDRAQRVRCGPTPDRDAKNKATSTKSQNSFTKLFLKF